MTYDGLAEAEVDRRRVPEGKGELPPLSLPLPLIMSLSVMKIMMHIIQTKTVPGEQRSIHAAWMDLPYTHPH